MNATTIRRLLAMLLLAASLSAAFALECGAFHILRGTSYDAFGVLIDRTGTTDNSFLYCGERWDANLGFYYLRARYMNPGTGRFWTMDEFEGMHTDPNTLHKFTYCRSSPLDRADASGYTDYSVPGFMTNMAVNAEITARYSLAVVRAGMFGARMAKSWAWLSTVVAVIAQRGQGLYNILGMIQNRGADLLVRFGDTIRRAMELKAWNLDKIARNEKMAEGMLDQMSKQASRYVAEMNDIIYAFGEYPNTEAGRQLMEQARQRLIDVGVKPENITFGLTQLQKLVDTIFKE